MEGIDKNTNSTHFRQKNPRTQVIESSQSSGGSLGASHRQRGRGKREDCHSGFIKLWPWQVCNELWWTGFIGISAHPAESGGGLSVEANDQQRILFSSSDNCFLHRSNKGKQGGRIETSRGLRGGTRETRGMEPKIVAIHRESADFHESLTFLESRFC